MTRTPDWMLERLLAGDLPADEAERVRARLASEGGLGRLDVLRAEGERFRAAHPPGPALAEIRRRAGLPAPRRRSAGRWLLAPAALALAAAVAVVLLPRGGGEPGAGSGGDGFRGKGLAPHLEVHRQRASAGPERLADGQAVRPGDLLQVSYVAAEARFGAVVSVDGRGGVTLHWPEGSGPAAELESGRAVPLPHAYRLDDAPGFERFFLVTGAARFDTGAVLEAARRLAASGRARTDPLPLAAGLEQRALVLIKERR